MRVCTYNVERSLSMIRTSEPVPAGLLAALRSHTWFAACDERFQLALLAEGRLHHLSAGDTLFARGQEGDGLCCVVAGALKGVSVNPRDGSQRLWLYLEPYHWFGEISSLDAQPRVLDAVADQDSRVLVVPRARLEAWLYQHPEHWRELARLACSKLRWMLAASEDQDTLPLAQQVARRLVLSSSNMGQAPWGHWRRRVRLPQEFLASMLGVSRQTVNKALRELEGEGLLQLGYAEIEILQLEALTRRAGTFDPVVYPGMKLPVDLTWPDGT